MIPLRNQLLQRTQPRLRDTLLRLSDASIFDLTRSHSVVYFTLEHAPHFVRDARFTLPLDAPLYSFCARHLVLSVARMLLFRMYATLWAIPECKGNR